MARSRIALYFVMQRHLYRISAKYCTFSVFFELTPLPSSNIISTPLFYSPLCHRKPPPVSHSHFLVRVRSSGSCSRAYERRFRAAAFCLRYRSYTSFWSQSETPGSLCLRAATLYKISAGSLSDSCRARDPAPREHARASRTGYGRRSSAALVVFRFWPPSAVETATTAGRAARR